MCVDLSHCLCSFVAVAVKTHTLLLGSSSSHLSLVSFLPLAEGEHCLRPTFLFGCPGSLFSSMQGDFSNSPGWAGCGPLSLPCFLLCNSSQRPRRARSWQLCPALDLRREGPQRPFSPPPPGPFTGKELGCLPSAGVMVEVAVHVCSLGPCEQGIWGPGL